MNLIYITLEFNFQPFSGNGMYSMSQVRSLVNLKHNILVVCAKPLEVDEPDIYQIPGAKVISVPVPVWGRLDLSCCWKQFADGVQNDRDIKDQILKHSAQAVLGVDWSSLNTTQIIQNLYLEANQIRLPFIYLNFRVYSRIGTEEEKQELLRREIDCVHAADQTLVLCRSDKDFLFTAYIQQTYNQQQQQKKIQHENPEIGGSSVQLTKGGSSRKIMQYDGPDIAVLLPPLRASILDLPVPPDVQNPEKLQIIDDNVQDRQQDYDNEDGDDMSQQEQVRNLVLCCVRVSPEKEPQRFVNIAEYLHKNGVLDELCLKVVMVAPAQTEYSQEIQQSLQAKCPSSRIVASFLSAQQLARLYSKAIINIHPCSYDAYGMTIVEAASQGCPSLVNDSDIGATDLLSPDRSEVVSMNFTESNTEEIAEQLADWLRRRRDLMNVGIAASVVARSWDELSNAQSLVDYTTTAIECKTGS